MPNCSLELPRQVPNCPSPHTSSYGKAGAKFHGLKFFSFPNPRVECLLGRMNGSADDKIHICELEIFARVGVSDEERAEPQRLTLNISLWPRASFRDLADDVSRTIDYSVVCAESRRVAGARANKLIETLADQIADHLLRTFPTRQVSVELRKFALPDAQYAAVIVNRTADAD
jgi:dihydroneopterin aldolase